jgi:hypothetical protein
MLTTNGAGANPSWVAAATSGPLPSQTGNSGKLLTTDGSNASWSSAIASSATGFNVAVGVTPFVELEVDSTSTSSPRGIMSAQFSTGTDGARFHFRKARGTRASPTTIVTGDNIGRLVGTGYDGASYLEMASIYFASEGTIATNRVPTNIQFWTATDASPSVLTLAGKFDSAQKLTVSGSLTVSGTVNSIAGTTSFGNAIQAKGSGSYASLGSSVFLDQLTSAISRLGVAGADASTNGTFTLRSYRSDATNAVNLIDASTTAIDFRGVTTSGTSTTAAAILGKSMGLTENLIVGGNIVVPQSPSKIDFGGTGANVLRANGAELQIGNTNGSSTGFNLKVIDQNSMAFQLQITGGSVFFDSAAGNINFRPGVATALTLAATSLNATFASTTEATTGGAGSLTTAGGIYAAKKIITASTLTTLGGATFHTTSSALTDGAGILTATLTNAPAVGNPTKWVGINDNGVTRYLPAW